MDNARVAEQHYENFPVASLLCPAELRPAVMAIYRFARSADDLADEGDDAGRAAQRTSWRPTAATCRRCCAGQADSGRWPAVFSVAGRAHPRARAAGASGCTRCSMPSSRMCATRAMPTARRCWTTARARPTRSVGCCCTCTASAMRLSLRQSDAICTALQLINFWQDLSVDLPRDRVYVPLADLQRHGARRWPQLLREPDAAATRALVRDLVQWAGALMAEGAPLALRLPGRIGWELRLVVQGGLRILEKIAAMDYASVRTRPVLGRKRRARAAVARPADAMMNAPARPGRHQPAAVRAGQGRRQRLVLLLRLPVPAAAAARRDHRLLCLLPRGRRRRRRDQRRRRGRGQAGLVAPGGAVGLCRPAQPSGDEGADAADRRLRHPAGAPAGGDRGLPDRPAADALSRLRRPAALLPSGGRRGRRGRGQHLRPHRGRHGAVRAPPRAWRCS